jgi:hypothetical protein
VAPSWVLAVLALEVWPSRTTADSRAAPELIGQLASANRTWGEERIVSELRLKLGISLSPRTVRRYFHCARAMGCGPRLACVASRAAWGVDPRWRGGKKR